jgi:MarR-like DNA-binding transcriptional regulator SgrR of sgrS sRNA
MLCFAEFHPIQQIQMTAAFTSEVETAQPDCFFFRKIQHHCIAVIAYKRLKIIHNSISFQLVLHQANKKEEPRLFFIFHSPMQIGYSGTIITK